MFLKHWIETRALFSVENKLNELTGKKEESIFDSFCFDARDVSGFNPGRDEGVTGVRMKNGELFSIEIDYEDFKNELRRALEE